MKHYQRIAKAFLATALLSATPAFCAVVDVHSTGVSVTNGIDNYYTLTAAGTSAVNLTTTNNAPAYFSTNRTGSWAPDDVNSSWISPASSGAQSQAVGYYTYTTTFSMTGFDMPSASLFGEVAADDSVSLYLNGTQVFSSTAAWGQPSKFVISKGFVQNLNTLQVVVHNDTGMSGVDMTIRSDVRAMAPEPSSFAMMGAGFLAVGLFFRRKLKPATVKG